MVEGTLDAVGIENCVTAPDGVISPILFEPDSVNHTLPFGPAAICPGVEPVGSEYSLTAPLVDTWAIPFGPLAATGSVYSWKAPAVVIRPTLLALNSVNHSASSEPTVIPRGAE